MHQCTDGQSFCIYCYMVLLLLLRLPVSYFTLVYDDVFLFSLPILWQVYIHLKIIFLITRIWTWWTTREWCRMLEGLLSEPTPYTDGLVP
jgi:hypothetical protein